jgi:hypothetical protein
MLGGLLIDWSVNQEAYRNRGTDWPVSQGHRRPRANSFNRVRRPRPRPEPIRWLREELPLLVDRFDRRTLLIAAGALAGVALLVWALVAGPLSSDDEPGATEVVTVAVGTDDVKEAPVGALGFPLVATRNTTRVGGADSASNAAAVALATHPPAPGADPIEAAVLVPDDDWQAGVAAASLAGPPLRAPLLIGGTASLPDPTVDALAQLHPRGGGGPSDAAIFAIGDVASAPGFETDRIEGDSPAELADAIDRLRQRLLRQEANHVVVATQDEAAFAMPAAAWAARSSDPVLFTKRDEVPEATLKALRRHRGTPVYVLGGPTVITDKAVRELERISPGVERVGSDDPVQSAIEFARYTDSSFGWNINDPGHGLVLANTSNPLDAAAAATLSASGKWGPLLLTDVSRILPAELSSFLLDIKPGYDDDPTRAVYNHIWLIGDAEAIGAAVQAELDELAEVAEVGPGAGGPVIEEADGGGGVVLPGGPEDEPQAKPGKKGKP